MLKTGGTTQHGLRQLLMDADDQGDEGLARSLGLEEEDVKKLLCMDDDSLCKVVSHCMRLHYPISESAFPLFSAIREKLEQLMEHLASDDAGALRKRCEERDRTESDRSSSPLLLWAAKDEKFRKKLSADQKKALDKWTYPGWCPLDASNRLRQLLKFPIEKFSVPDAIAVPLLALEEAASIVSCPSPPKVSQKTEDESPHEKSCETIVRRLMGLQSELEKWESYYADAARVLSKLHLSMLLSDDDQKR